jgi:hypothetical protein
MEGNMSTLFIQPPNTMPRINEIWAFVSVDPADGNEGVVAFYSSRFESWMPLIAADTKRLEQMRAIAMNMLRDLPDCSIKLVKFTTREEVETLTLEG